MEISTGNNTQVATAMAMAGRSARPCDVCGRGRARWYCAADEAYLCHRCDGSVHSANAVAFRHERVRVNPSGLPTSKPARRSSPSSSAIQISKESIYTTKDSSQRSIPPSCGWQHRSHKKPRSSRHHPTSSAISAISHSSNGREKDQQTSMVKAEPPSPTLLEIEPSSSSLYLHIRSKQELDEAPHEVPVLLPLKQEFSPRSLPDCTLLISSLSDDAIANDDALGFLVPDDYAMDRFIDSAADLGEIEMKKEASMGEEASIDMELPMMDDLEVLGLCGGHDLCGEDFSIDFSSLGAFRVGDGASDGEYCGEDRVEGSGDDLSVEKVKIEEESWEDGEGLKIEVDEMLACEWNGWQEEEVKQKISLRLNYEDVLSAWSDRGPLWADGRSCQMVPDDSGYDTSVAATNTLDYGCFDIGLVPDISLCSGTSTTGEQLGQVPVVNVGEEGMNVGAREARVMRYREKRRTRLFSKKIRYEVRKLNAERRPRLKGRFVKKSTSL